MESSVKKTVRNALFATVGMFAFGFALVPIYDVFCDITGLNGKTSDSPYTAVDVAVDTSRNITVQFVATNNENMPWEFKPAVSSMVVHPGEAVSTEFFVRNPKPVSMVAQAVPSVVPFKAAEYFHKTECFCFNQQPLDGRSETLMPLRFIVDVDLPKDVKTITLAYTLFDVTESFKTAAVDASAEAKQAVGTI